MGVKYLVLGGYAVNYYGHHRNTKDMDIWIAVSGDNPERVSRALQEFGFAASDVPPAQFAIKGAMHTFGREPFRVDILSNPSGVDFEKCYARRIDGKFDGILIPFISLADLRDNKLASGRLQDQADLESLPKKVIAKKRLKRSGANRSTGLTDGSSEENNPLRYRPQPRIRDGIDTVRGVVLMVAAVVFLFGGVFIAANSGLFGGGETPSDVVNLSALAHANTPAHSLSFAILCFGFAVAMSVLAVRRFTAEPRLPRENSISR